MRAVHTFAVGATRGLATKLPRKRGGQPERSSGRKPQTARLPLAHRSRGSRTVAHFEKRLCLPARRSRPALPFERRSPERGTIAQTKTGRPTQSLERTADSVSNDRGLCVVFARATAVGLSRAARLAPNPLAEREKIRAEGAGLEKAIG